MTIEPVIEPTGLKGPKHSKDEFELKRFNWYAPTVIVENAIPSYTIKRLIQFDKIYAEYKLHNKPKAINTYQLTIFKEKTKKLKLKNRKKQPFELTLKQLENRSLLFAIVYPNWNYLKTNYGVEITRINATLNHDTGIPDIILFDESGNSIPIKHLFFHQVFLNPKIKLNVVNLLGEGYTITSYAIYLDNEECPPFHKEIWDACKDPQFQWDMRSFEVNNNKSKILETRLRAPEKHQVIELFIQRKQVVGNKEPTTRYYRLVLLIKPTVKRSQVTQVLC